MLGAAVLCAVTAPHSAHLKDRPALLEERYLSLVEKAVTGALIDEAGSCSGPVFPLTGCPLDLLQPYVPAARENGSDWPPFGFTMVGSKRVKNMRMAIEAVTSGSIPGAIVEAGVWRGGLCIFSKLLLDVLGERRSVHLLDAFGTLPYGSEGVKDYLAVSLDQVKHNFRKFDALDTSVHFHRGIFQHTIPKLRKALDAAHEQIAVLRVDGNFYDSHQDALYQLYELVPVGGIVIFDDCYSNAVLQFWKDFCSDQGAIESFTPIDQSAGWFRKVKAIRIDWSKARPAVDVDLPGGATITYQAGNELERYYHRQAAKTSIMPKRSCAGATVGTPSAGHSNARLFLAASVGLVLGMALTHWYLLRKHKS